jgi:hypothetical protein
MATNLPSNTNTDSTSGTRQFFDTYYSKGMSFPAETIDAVIGFFLNNGFSQTAAETIGGTLLKQSRVENVNVFQLIDTMRNLNQIQLSRVVSEILNYNRLRISTLGYKVTDNTINQFEIRNIIA